MIKLHISKDGTNYVHWQTINTELKAGKQVFNLREKVAGNDLNYLKLEIVKTHG
jgi:hypothetical protein